jgi:hypothetical protein
MVKMIADTIYVYGSAPAVAIMDAAAIMHVGCTASDQSLVLEARKRCVFAVNGLRLEVSRSRPEMALSGVLILVMGILANQVGTVLFSASQTRLMRGFRESNYQQTLNVADSISRCIRLSRMGQTRYLRSPAPLPSSLHAAVTNKTQR